MKKAEVIVLFPPVAATVGANRRSVSVLEVLRLMVHSSSKGNHEEVVMCFGALAKEVGSTLIPVSDRMKENIGDINHEELLAHVLENT